MNGQCKWHQYGLIILSLIALAGCQSLPAPESKQPLKPAQTEKPDIKIASGVVITPYDREEIQRQKIPLIVSEQQRI